MPHRDPERAKEYHAKYMREVWYPQNKKRHIVDPDTFDKHGLDRSQVIEVSAFETSMHDLGEEL